ncbi:MAG: hypothetical protein ABIR62_05380 [Dokdonella sp.]|uniref:hypothetical protein n=1 Tax=Dokdonella sp. TaxID=2291710 RepID=UPI003267235D
MIHVRLFFVRATALGVLLLGLMAQSSLAASRIDDESLRVPAALSVRGKLAAPSAGVNELKFQDVFKLPAGPRGLEPTARLLDLDGKRVRIVGYMVQQDARIADSFLLSPLPVLLGDEDESLADDLPPSTLRVELPTSRGVVVPALPGLLQLTGTLRVGMQTDAATGRATPARLVLDATPERLLRKVAKAASSADRANDARKQR